ncbi:MAG: SRPBCC family protein [Pseudomonadota bacterium]
MLSVEATHTFDLPIDEVWSYLGDFGNTSKWSGSPKEACVQEGDGIGALRTLTFADGTIIVDRLEEQTDYSYTYSVVSGPLPIESYRATMSVSSLDDSRTEFTWQGKFKAKGITDEQCIEFFRGVYAQGIEMMKKTLRS